MTSAATVPDTLRAIRASLQLTQTELAERLGVSFATVNRWEGGDGTTKVQKAKLKNGCGELYSLDKSGNRIELFVDPSSGKIVGQL